MLKHSFSDFSYAVNIDSARKGYKEILVCYIYNGTEVLRKVYVPEGPGISYIFEARKIIDKEIKDGTLSSYSYRFVRRNKKKRIKPRKIVKAVSEGKSIASVAGFAGFTYAVKPSANLRKKFVEVNYTYNGEKVTRTLKLRGKPTDDYIAKAKDKINEETESGFLEKYSEKYLEGKKLLDSTPTRTPVVRSGFTGKAVATICIVAALVIAGATLGVYYGTRNSNPDVPTPPAPADSYSVTFHTGEYITPKEPDTIAAGDYYNCEFEVDESINRMELCVSGITMGDIDLEEGNDYNIVEHRLHITKPADGDIIISASVRPNSFNVYSSLVNCHEAQGAEIPETIGRYGILGFNVQPEDRSKQDVDLVVAMSGKRLIAGTDYTYNTDPASPEFGAFLLSKDITGNITVVANGKDKVRDTYDVTFNGYRCTSTGSAIATPDTAYLATLSPDEQRSKVSVLSIVVGDKSLILGQDYTFNEASGELSINAGAVKNDIKISAIGYNDDKDKFDVSKNGINCEIAGEAEVDKNDTYECTVTPITGLEIDKTALSVSMGGVILHEEESTGTSGYTFTIDGEGKGALIINKKAVGDIVICAYAKRPTVASYSVAKIGDERCEFTGVNEIDKDAQFTGTITSKDADYTVVIKSVTMGGTNIPLSTNPDHGYTFDSGGNFKILDGANGNIVIVALSQKKTETKYKVNFSGSNCTSSGESEVEAGSTTYTAILTAGTDMVPLIIDVYMGGAKLSASTDYQLVEADNTYTFSLLKAASGDVDIFAVGVNEDRDYYNITTYNYDCNITGAPTQVAKNQTFSFAVAPKDIFNKVAKVVSVTMGGTVLTEGTDYNLSDGTFSTKKPAAGDFIIYFTATDPDVIEGVPAYTFEGNEAIVSAVNAPTGHTIAEIEEVTIPNEIENTLTNAVVPVTKLAGTGMLNGFSKLKTLSIPFIGLSSTPNPAAPYENIFGKIFGSSIYDGVGSLTWQEFYLDEAETAANYRIDKTAIPLSLETVNVTAATQIPCGAFSQCRTIKNINIQSKSGTTITEIGGYAFYGCSTLQNIIYPSTVSTINWRAFQDCRILTTADLTHVTTVSHHVFYNCSGLQKIALTSSIQNVGNEAFSNITNSVITCADTRSQVQAKQESGKWSKTWVDELTSVIYGSSGDLSIYTDKTKTYRFIVVKDDSSVDSACVVEYIGDDRATDVTVPATLTGTVGGAEKTYPLVEIGSTVFYGFTKIVNLKFEGSNLQYIDNYCFTSCPSIKNITGLDGLTKLKSIGSYAFDRCGSITGKLTLPASVNNIGKYCFAYCSSTNGFSVDMSKTKVTTLTERLFYLSSLTSITLPTDNLITSLEGEIFSGCSKLTSLSITPNASLNYIPTSICENCTSLQSFKWEATNLVNIYDRAFSGCTSLTGLYINGTDTANTIPTTLMHIGDEALANCTAITTFSLGTPSSAQRTGFTMGSKVFKDWTSSQTLYMANQTGEWAESHSGTTGAIVLTFNWTLIWTGTIFVNYKWACSSSGSTDLVIRDI